MTTNHRNQIAHLARRAGFGATPQELDAYEKIGYEALVEQLLNPASLSNIPDD